MAIRQSNPYVTGQGRSQVLNEQKINAAIDALYEAAGDVECWPKAMMKIAECFESGQAILHVRPENYTAPYIMAIPYGIESQYLDAYQKYFWQSDLWCQAGDRKGIRSGKVVTSEELVEKRNLVNSEFYADFLRHLNIKHNVVGVADSTNANRVHMTVFGSPRRGEFSNASRSTMQALLPALRTATRSTLQLRHYSSNLTTMLGLFNKISQPIFLVDGNGILVQMNVAGEEFITRSRVLKLVNGRLISDSIEKTAEIRRMIWQAAVPTSVPAPVMLVDHLGYGVHHLSAHPVRSADRARNQPFQPREVAVAVCVVSVNSQLQVSEDLIARAFGLTGAEARLAARIPDGGSLREIAEELGVSYGTARSQLKTVFQKTGTSNQVELTSTVLNFGKALMAN